MKFLTKINRNFFIMFTIILIFISIVGYYVLAAILMDDAKENLMEKEALIKNQIAETGILPNMYPLIEVKKINKRTIAKPLFRKIFIQDNLEDELEPFLEYSNQVKINDTIYYIRLRQSTFENEDLLTLLALSFFILLFFVFGISFFITKKMNKTVWKDFEKNLHTIENFSFIETKNLTLLKSDIEEFDRLNKVIASLTEKLKSDYLSLKEFTENASHEIQTPLSIVMLNLEEVLQQNLNKETFKKVHASINAVKRLSTLNQSLVLLTKIENRQFEADRKVNINEIVKNKIKEFTNLFETKKLKVEFLNNHEFHIKINEQLAELLIVNLLSNAINHNIDNGFIQIEINENELKICNSGENNGLTNETIFNRFVKGNSKSYGLGLAIVKNICETNQIEIKYLKNILHCFVLKQKFCENSVS